MLDNNAKLIDKILLLKEQNKDSKLLTFFFKISFLSLYQFIHSNQRAATIKTNFNEIS